jgi:hypothetical protein
LLTLRPAEETSTNRSLTRAIRTSDHAARGRERSSEEETQMCKKRHVNPLWWRFLVISAEFGGPGPIPPMT